MDQNDLLVVVAIVAFIWILGILIFRQIRLWYWKVNERINEQRKTNALLKGIYDLLYQQTYPQGQPQQGAYQQPQQGAYQQPQQGAYQQPQQGAYQQPQQGTSGQSNYYEDTVDDNGIPNL